MRIGRGCEEKMEQEGEGMTEKTVYTFMPAEKVYDLDMLLNGLEDYIFGDLEGRKLTENRMKGLSDKFTEIDQIIRSCKKKEVKE